MSKVVLNNGREISNFSDPYFIAEFNSSHFGSLDTARKMIEEAKKCGCDCVKFQSWSADTLYSEGYYRKNPIAKRMVDKFALKGSELKLLAAYCSKIGIDFSSTPYSLDEAMFLVKECNVPFLKIASMELNNLPFLRELANLKMPLVLSTGMGQIDEICSAVETITSAGNSELIVLHCTAVYPSEFDIIRLKNISGLRDLFPQLLIGYSDHSIGIEIPTAAIALGARVIEKHFTLDNSKIGLDNQMATEPNEMKKMVRACINVHKALGGRNRVLSNSELAMKPKMRRSIVTKRDLRAGEKIELGKIEFKRPGDGIPPTDLERILGKQVNRDINHGELIEFKDIDL